VLFVIEIMEVESDALIGSLNNSDYWMESGKIRDVRSFLENISSDSVHSVYYMRRDEKGVPSQVVYLGDVAVAPKVIGQFIDDCMGRDSNPFLTPRVEEVQLEGGKVYDITLSEGKRKNFSHKLKLVFRE